MTPGTYRRTVRTLYTLALALCLLAPLPLCAAGEADLTTLDRQRFSATRLYNTAVTEEDALRAAESAARATAMQRITRTIAALPELRINADASAHSPHSPNLLALARAAAAVPVLLQSKSRKDSSVTVTVQIRLHPDAQSLTKNIRKLLVQPQRLRLYLQAALREKALLEFFDTHCQQETIGDPALCVAAINEMRALDLFTQILPLRDKLWNEPQTVHETMQKAVALAPDSPLFRNANAEALLRMGRNHAAVEQLNVAIKADPAYAQAYASRSAASLALGYHTSALADISEAIRLAPREAEYYQTRGMAQYLNGNTGAMCADMRQACVMGLCEGLQWAIFHNHCPADAVQGAASVLRPLPGAGD